MDLKEFWEASEMGAKSYNDKGFLDYIKELREEQGMFFWERGGKQFIFAFNGKHESFTLSGLIEIAKKTIGLKDVMVDADSVLWANDFLMTLACLGEDKIKELIKEMK